MSTGSEAPISLSTTLYYKGFGIIVTQRDSDEKVMPFILNRMKMIDWAIEQGMKPSWNPDTNKASLQEGVKESPICGIHGGPMLWKTGTSKTTQKPYAFWACPTKNADGTFCNFKSPKS